MKRSFVMFVVAAMIGGFIAGMIVHGTLATTAPSQAADGYFNQVTNIFLRLIKMIIAPLVLTTLTAGIGHIESAATVGRIGTKAMIWFLSASFVALLIGLVMVNLLEPGVGAGVAQVAAASAEAGVAPPQGLTGLPGASDPRLDLRRDGEERDPAGGGVLAVRGHRHFGGGRKGQGAAAHHRTGRHGDPEDHHLCDDVRALRHLRRHRGRHLHPGHRHPGHLCQAGGRLLYLDLHPDRADDLRRLAGGGRPDEAAAQGHPLARADRLFHFDVRSRLSAAAGIAGSDGLLVQDRQLRAAAGLQLQSGRARPCTAPSRPCSSPRPTTSTSPSVSRC